MNDRLCPNWGGANQPPGRIDQSSEMEHHLRRDEGQLLELHDQTKLEVARAQTDWMEDTWTWTMSWM